MFEMFILGCLVGVIVSSIMHAYIYRNVDPCKVDLIEGYYDED